MPYTTRLIPHRTPANAAGGQIRKLLRLIQTKGGVDETYKARVIKALQEAHALLYASVDYLDDGRLLGLVGEYEEAEFRLRNRAIPDYQVSWTIDIEAPDEILAAQAVACRYFQEHIGIGEPDSACVFDVLDKDSGVVTRVDLSARKES